jgi:ankyrin repeat protein
MTTTLKQIFSYSEEKLDQILEDYEDENDYNNIEKINAVIIYLFNDKKLSKEDSKIVKSKEYNLIINLGFENYKDFIDYYNEFKLKMNTSKNVTLCWVSENGHLQIVKYLVENGADIHAINDRPLRSASKHGYLEIVKYLVENGANIHAKDDEALTLASYNGRLNVVKYLIEKGANIHAKDDDALKWALQNAHLEVVKYLVEKGADIHSYDDALKWALQNGHLDVVKYLVENGANIHANDDYALRLASRNGHLEIVKLLVENGANIHADDDGALIEASKNGHLEVVKYLVENGSNIHAKDDYPLRWASHNGHLEVVRYLNQIILNRNILYENNLIRTSPLEEASETIVLDPKFIHICNSGNNFEYNEETKIEEPIDPLDFEPIPSNLYVSVKRINDIKNKNTTCFNALNLYKHWLAQSQNRLGITYKYASNPLNRGYFNEQSVNHVIKMLKGLNLI